MSGKTKRCASRAAQGLRMAANSLRTRQSALGAYFRRTCARMDKLKTITPAANNRATDLHHAYHGEDNIDQGQDYFEKRYR
jgi:hypothetical protein